MDVPSGMKTATNRAHITRNAPNTNGGPGTSCNTYTYISHYVNGKFQNFFVLTQNCHISIKNVPSTSNLNTHKSRTWYSKNVFSDTTFILHFILVIIPHTVCSNTLRSIQFQYEIFLHISLQK